MVNILPDLPFGIYIHWPYCTRICPYCDFNVYKAKPAGRSVDHGADLLDAILSDLSYWRELSGPRTVTSIHFGGGTPSLMSAFQISAIIEKIDALWSLSSAPSLRAQIALEANPSNHDAELWREYACIGIGRLSLGVQSFDEAVLTRLGRDHNSGQAQAALDQAMTIFDQVSADLIFGHAGQNLSGWQKDLNTALKSGVQHLSCYQLTIEPGTAFAQAEKRGQHRAVDSDKSADMYEETCNILGAAGYRHYEVSNFAKLEREIDHRSSHNLVYWLGGDYVGVGPGAHGRLTRDCSRLSTIAYMKPGDYIASVGARGHGLFEQELLSAHDHAAEYVMMGLRIDEGISLSRYADIAGETLQMAEAQHLIDTGLLHKPAPERLAATAAGRPLLDSITRLLLGA